MSVCHNVLNADIPSCCYLGSLAI